MSSEEIDTKKRKRRATPIQHLKRGDKSFYVVYAKAVDEKVYSVAKVGEPSTNKDEKLSTKNLCFGITGNTVERILVNPEGKFRIPSDKELTTIYSTCKRNEDATIKIKDKEFKIYDSRWTDSGGLKSKWEKKKNRGYKTEKKKVVKKPDKKKTKVTKESIKKELEDVKKKLKELE